MGWLSRILEKPLWEKKIDNLSVSTWRDLLKHSQGLNPKQFELSPFPYHFLFAAIENQLQDKSYFQDIPFRQVTQDMIDKSIKYIENPTVTTTDHFLLQDLVQSKQYQEKIGGGITLRSDRYRITPERKIARTAIPPIDRLICQSANCLSGQGSYNPHNPEETMAYACKAIHHYAQIPTVRFFLHYPF